MPGGSYSVHSLAPHNQVGIESETLPSCECLVLGPARSEVHLVGSSLRTPRIQEKVHNQGKILVWNIWAASRFFCPHRTLLIANQVSHQLSACLRSAVSSSGSLLLNSSKLTKLYPPTPHTPVQTAQTTLHASLFPFPQQGHPHTVLTCYHCVPGVCTDPWRVREQMLEALQGIYLHSSHQLCPCSVGAARGNLQMSERGSLPIKLYLQKQGLGQ